MVVFLLRLISLRGISVVFIALLNHITLSRGPQQCYIPSVRYKYSSKQSHGDLLLVFRLHHDKIFLWKLLIPDHQILEVAEVNEVRGVMSLACLVCLRRRLYLLPLITTLWIIMSLFISYGIAVSYGHTEPDFPYISHTAIEAPERCVFGQLVNIGAVMLVMNVLVRYLFLKEIFKHKKMHNVHQWQNGNIAGVVIGVLSALGMSMVANFQTEVQRGPHYAGAGLAFVMGTAYVWLHTHITWRLRREGIGNTFLAVVRFINCFVLTCLLIIFTISKTYYKVKEYLGEGTKNDTLRAVYLTSTISEWLVAASILAYTLSFTWDFRSIVLESPKVKLNFQQLENGKNNNRTPTEMEPKGGTTPV